MHGQALYKKLPGPRFYRFLEIHKGSRSERLRGTLFQLASLDTPFLYEALSYRWSEVDSKNPALIEIDGEPFSIGPDLYAALLQFRTKELQRYLWIDQICINQGDEKEKLQQIEIMGDIYSKAQKVLIWLGAADDQSDVAMEFFPIFVRQILQNDQRSSSQQPSEPPSDVIKYSGTLATILSKLFTRSWFGRVWTLQEAILAQKAEVWCGEKSFLYSVLGEFERGCHTDRYGHWGNALKSIPTGADIADPENPNRSLIAHIHIVSSLREGAVLSSARILSSLRSLDCSEHRDRIYSILRFLAPELARKIVQRQGPSPAELYCLVAMEELRRGEVDYLGAAGLSQHRVSYVVDRHESSRPRLSIPSWVPDWTYTPRTHSYWVLQNDCLQKRGTTLFSAGGSQPDEHNFSFSDDGQILHVGVVFIDKISECAAPFRVMRSPKDLTDLHANLMTVLRFYKQFQSYIASCMQLAAKCTSRYGSSNIERACRHALVGRMMPDGLTTSLTGVLVRASDEFVDSIFEDFETLLSVQEEMAWFSQRTQAGTPFTDDEFARVSKVTAAMQSVGNTMGQFSKQQGATQAMAEACKGRRFFVTDQKHYMGVVPDITLPGDEICVIPGCCAPFVVRPNGTRYQLIGECYVAGIMDGETIEKTVSLESINFV